jgi:Putative Flp pilus-assembly TadE/G-like
VGWRRRRRGATYVLTLMMLPLLVACLACATDLGVVVVRRQRLQSVVDASAAAGGSQFGQGGDPGPKAKAVAENYALAHGYDVTAASGHSDTPAPLAAGGSEVTCQGAPTRLDIRASERVPTFFLRLFDIDGITVTAKAAVERSDRLKDGAVNKVEGTFGYRGNGADSAETEARGALTPLALNADLFRSGVWANYGPSFENVGAAQIKLTGDQPSSSAPAFLVTLGGATGKLNEYARHGYSDPVRAGDRLPIQPTAGDWVTVCLQLAERAGNDADSANADSSSWRRLATDSHVLLVPVVKWLDVNQVEVDGFAAIEVVNINGNTLSVRLVNVVAPQAEVDPAVKSQTTATHYGLFGVRLVE